MSGPNFKIGSCRKLGVEKVFALFKCTKVLFAEMLSALKSGFLKIGMPLYL